MPVIGYLSQGMPGMSRNSKERSPNSRRDLLLQDIDKVGEGESKSNQSSGREISELA